MGKTYQFKSLRYIVLIFLALSLATTTVLSQTEKLDDSPKKTTKKKPGAKKKAAAKKDTKAKKKRRERLIYIDFRDKPINDFMKAMTKVLKRNILVDETVKGKITIISNKGIPQSKVFPFFKSVLESKGYAVIEEKNLIKIVSIKDAIAKSGKDVRVGRDRINEDEMSLDRIYTQVVSIVNAEAQQVAGILKSIATKSTTILVYNRLNTIVMSGSGPEINTLLGIIDQLDRIDECKPDDPECIEEEESRGNIHIYQMVHHKAEKIAQVLVKLDNPGVDTGKSTTTTTKETKGKKGKKKKKKRTTTKSTNRNKRPEKIKAVAHKETNSLIITATAEEYRAIKKIVKQLDVERKQVLVEVLIAEVSADAANSFGIDWSFTPDKNFPGGGVQNNTGLIAESGVVDLQTQDPTGINTLMGFSFGFVTEGKERVIALANLNKNNDNFSILSSPQVMTLENEEAEINVGSDVPVITGARTSGTSDAVTQTFEYRPIGIKLKFTPSINANDSITLDLFQEIKEIAGDTGTTQSNPRFTKRDVKTFITVKNEKTVVIAGLVSSNRNKIIRKIPVLGDIPILGYLFKRESQKVVKTNLLVFITPYILNNIQRQKEIMERKRREQLQFYEQNIAN